MEIDYLQRKEKAEKLLLCQENKTTQLLLST